MTSSVSQSSLNAKFARIIIFVLLVHVGLICSICHAGGGSENVFLVVNSTSRDSITIANHYIALRQIPASNVFYISYKGSKAGVSGDAFRKQILLPVLAEIKRRKLSAWIDYVVYSCDFPWRVSFTSDFPEVRFPRSHAPRGSLTGLTFLYQFTEKKRKEVVSLNTNLYFVESTKGLTVSRAFRSRYHWSIGGKRAPKHGLSYLLSAMLGVTDGRGNTVKEIVHSLQRAKAAEGTSPSGTVYLMKNQGVRSTVRHGRFASAAVEIRAARVAAKILEGKYPSQKSAIAGLTCGTAYVDFGKAACRFLPGAFCDNLTSYGGVFSHSKNRSLNKAISQRPKNQVNISDFIRNGATIACGTVYEPTNAWHKFPTPSLHVHYTRGCSAAEAFYQSVSGPYQQLLVGDPLCQPWAVRPVIEVSEITAGRKLHGNVEFTPVCTNCKQTPLKEFELYVDGMRTQHCKPGEKLQLDSTLLADGYHEIRVVGHDSNPIETQGLFIAEVTVKNGLDALGLTTSRKKISASSEYVKVQVTCTRETPIELFHNGQVIARNSIGTGELNIPIEKLGLGPIRLYAKSKGLCSKPLNIEIIP